MQFQLFLENELATGNFGGLLASFIKEAIIKEGQQSLMIFLNGELGAGKTSLVRACLRALGVEGAIKSPTYTLLEPYDVRQNDHAGLKIAHLDLYRLQEPEELDYIGGRDLSINFNVIFIEWPEKGQGSLPDSDIKIQLNHKDRGRELLLYSDNAFIMNKLNSIKNS